jgi:ATP/maltotriose-dependent transcriptional regulator MalT
MATEEAVKLPVKGRVLDVLRLIHTGMSNREIGEKLFVCESTIKWHLTSAYKKFGVANRSQLLERIKEFEL